MIWIFQIIFDVSKMAEIEQTEFFLSLDNVFLRAADCPPELEPYFGTAPGGNNTKANFWEGNTSFAHSYLTMRWKICLDCGGGKFFVVKLV